MNVSREEGIYSPPPSSPHKKKKNVLSLIEVTEYIFQMFEREQ